MNYTRYELTCNPLDTYSEVLMFLQQPPAWRTLCKELKPHSTRKIRNIESHQFDDVSRITLDGPESFCHISPDADEDKRYDEKILPKTLVCHDMANGYHDDSIIDGTGNYDAYTFYNWAGIDIFCYFSHHLVTIPPLGWINVGHDHGVKVIGTVITEWADGIEFWEQVLESEEEYKNFASALVAIAKTLKFDGWLLNVENKIAKPDTLLEFVKHLHALLHQELADPVLIWYDSVTVEGHLNWQNALNHKNRAFFDACDGLFTNYSWTEEDVKSSAREAGDRIRDLFIGIDVWGRNFYGGGQFNVQEAVDVAHSHGCSLAIFAPAWTHEALTLEQSDVNAVALSDGLAPYDHFLLRDRALWDSVWRYLNTSLPCGLPFATSFCRGQGLTRRLYGEVICPVPWYNFRHMQYQPNTSHGPHGYLLSTIENIITASRTGILKDPNGIIKYRTSLLENKVVDNEVQQVKSEDDVDTEAQSGLIPKADSTGELETVAAAEASAEQGEGTENKSKLSLKRKMKNVFKHIFHRKNDYGDDARQHVKTEDGAKSPQWRVLESIPEQNSEPEIGPSKSENKEQKSPDPGDNGIKIDDLDREKQPTEPDKESSEPSRRKKQKPEFDDVVKTDETDQLPRDEEEEATGEDDPAPLTGRSMVQMSVHLKLKSKDERTRFGLACVPDELQCMEVFYEDAFLGGSCLKINPSDLHTTTHRTIRLLQCEFECAARLVFCVVTKKVVGHEEQFLNVNVHVRSARGEGHVVLVGRDVAQAAHSRRSAGFTAHVSPVGADARAPLRDLQAYILLNEPGFYVPIDNSYNWTVRYYEMEMPGALVTSINIDTGLSSGPILLGYFGICARPGRGEDSAASVKPDD